MREGRREEEEGRTPLFPTEVLRPVEYILEHRQLDVCVKLNLLVGARNRDGTMTAIRHVHDFNNNSSYLVQVVVLEYFLSSREGETPRLADIQPQLHVY